MVDVLISFDTTASMYPALSNLRQNINFLTTKLQETIPDLRIGIIGHGDYCTSNIYVTKHLDFTSNWTMVTEFVENLARTGGVWDDGEAYEQVLAVANVLSWRPATKKVLIMAGDDIPHPPFFKDNINNTDWRFELKRLVNLGVKIVAVQCLYQLRADFFYRELAETSNGYRLQLNQFAYITDLLVTIVFHQHSCENLEKYEQEMKDENRYTRNMQQVIDVLTNREPTISINDCNSAQILSRFQALDVTCRQSIKSFVQSFGIVFKQGRGFYQLSKKEKVSAQKEIILMEHQTGNFYTGSEARNLIGLPLTESAQLIPNSNLHYDVFIQSCSHNRILIPGTKFLYEVQLNV